ncbi:hypothetical protein ACFL6P_02195 [Candidatus Latescibacterota bacterium]
MKDPAEILNENPGSIIFARHAEELARSGNVDEALEILSSGINANPEYAAGYSVLAGININQGLHEAAIEHLEKALALEPQSPKDLLNLGKYFIDSEPEKAKEYLWKAHRYEPESPETETAFNEALSKTGDASAGDGLLPPGADEPAAVKKAPARSGLDLLKPIDVTDDTNGAIIVDDEEDSMPEQETETGDPFAEMLDDVEASVDAPLAEPQAETADDSVEPDEIDDEVSEEPAESKEPGDLDAPADIEEPEDMDDDIPEQPLDEADVTAPEDDTDAEDMLSGDGIEPVDEEGIVEKTGNSDVELMPETENALSEMLGETATPEEAPASEDEIETADELPGDGIEPVDDEGILEETVESDVELMPETENALSEMVDETVTPEEAPAAEDEIETADVQPEDETYAADELPGEIAEPESAEETPDETDSDDDYDIMQELASLSDEEEEEEEEEDDEVAEISEEIPGYSNILDKDIPKAPDLMINPADAGVLEINEEDSNYDISKFEQDTSKESGDEPVLPDDERAELLELEKNQEEGKKKPESEDTVDIRPESPGFSENSEYSENLETDSAQTEPEEILAENLYGDLSKDELEVLSDTDVEPDGEEKHLEIETNEGIDYSDILYGQEPSIESEDHSTQAPGNITLAPSVDISAELLPEEPSIEDMSVQDFDIADVPEDPSYADTIESIDSEIQDVPDDTEVTADNSAKADAAENIKDFPGDPENSAWDNPSDFADTAEETIEENSVDTAEYAAEPVVANEFDIEDLTDEVPSDIPGAPVEETVDEELSAEQEIENLTANEFDIEDTSGESLYADILTEDEPETTDIAEDVSEETVGDTSEDISENTAWDIPADDAGETDGEDDVAASSPWDISGVKEDSEEDIESVEESVEEKPEPEVTGEFDLDEMPDEVPADIPGVSVEETDEVELSAEQEIENLAANEFNIEDTPVESSYADILAEDEPEMAEISESVSEESADVIVGDTGEDTAESTAWDIPADADGETAVDETDEDAESPWDISGVADSIEEDTGSAEGTPEEQPVPEVASEFNLDDMPDAVPADIPEESYRDEVSIEEDVSAQDEASGEGNADEVTSAGMEIEDLSIRDIDEDVLGGEAENDESMSNGSHYLGLPVDDEEINDVENSSIGDLIYDYVAAMKESNVESDTEHSPSEQSTTGQVESPSVSGESEPDVEESDVELDLNGDISYDYEADDETPPDGEATATMAEIFVSQGLTQRAIEIYKVLQEQKSDNEEIKNRLEELQKTIDTQSGDE